MKQRERPSFSLSWLFWLSAAILIALKVWLGRGLTFNGIGYMAADDRLFLEQAAAILRGDWLGSYNYLTLFKGPFYPLFIAGVYLSGIPLLTAQQLLYALACLVFCLSLGPLIRRQVPLLLLLGVLLFNPMSATNTVATRVLREGIYPALTLLSLGGLIGVVLRLERPFRSRIAWILLSGFALGAFWLTREERIWILPALAVLLGLAVYRIWSEKNSRWRSGLVSLGLPFLLAAAAVLTVCGLNLNHYGLFAITEYDSPVFLKAYGSLTRVVPATWQPLIPVSAETRRRIYAVSPTFSQLEPWLEGDLGLLYARYGENVKQDSREMGGGWFHMAFRAAVDAAGLTENGRFPREFYSRMTAEIDRACNSGELECGPPRSSFMAVWNKAYLPSLVTDFGRAARYLVSFEGYDGSLRECLGTDEQLALFVRLTREPCRHPQLSVLVRAWVVKPDDALSVWVYDGQGDKLVSPTYHMLSPDLAEHFARLGLEAPEAGVARFQLQAVCPSGCELVVKGGDGSILERIGLGTLSASPDVPDGNGLYYQVESIDWREGDEQAYASFYRLNRIRARILEIVAAIFQGAMPFFAGLALLAYLVQMAVLIKNRGHLLQRLVETILLIAILTRLVVVAWLETSSIDAIITTYHSPLYPLLVAFIFLTLSGALQSGLERIKHPQT